jgi:Leucine-rich repeat (LRR) protein
VGDQVAAHAQGERGYDCFESLIEANVMLRLKWPRGVVVGAMLSLMILTGCPKSETPIGGEKPASVPPPQVDTKTKPAKTATASADDVKAARERLKALGASAKSAPKDGEVLTEIVIQEGSNLTANDLALFGKLSDLEKLHIFNCRTLDDEMAAKLSGLKRLTSLAITNSVINDPTVEMIVSSFPNLTELDLSSNTNMTKGAMTAISELSKLQRLTLVQNRFNEISTMKLKKLTELRAIDLRGNMEAGNMAFEVLAELPKLTGLKHRSPAVTDSGVEALSKNQTLDSLLMQDFAIGDSSGPHVAKLGKLTQLEIFRCQGFGTEGVLALKGMNLTRLTLRDLPNVDDRALEVLDELPKLRRLFLHELTSVGDSGLQHLAALKSLEQLDIWTIPQMTDATIEVVAALPNLKDLTIRATGVTDASIDKLLGMQSLQSLTFKENGSVTAEGLKKLASRKWTKLDVGGSGSDDSAAQ